MPHHHRWPEFARLFNLIARSAQALGDGEGPATNLGRMNRELARRLQRVEPEALETEVLLILKEIAQGPTPFVEIVRGATEPVRKLARSDPRYSRLMALAAEAAAKRSAPHLAAVVWHPRSREQDRLDRLRGSWHLRHAAILTGEPRLFETLAAVVPVIDFAYVPFLRHLVTLAHVVDEDPRSPTKEFGSLLEQASSAYPALVEPRAKHLRSAAAHSNWEAYDDQSDTFEIWDARTPRRRVKVGEVLGDVTSMWTLAGFTFGAVRDLLNIEIAIDLGFDELSVDLIEGALRRDRRSVSRLLEEFARRHERVLGPAHALMAERAKAMPARSPTASSALGVP